MNILVIPDKFKGTLTASEAANAIARGWHKARSRDAIELLPMSDGGDGFGETLGNLLRAKIRTVRTLDAARQACAASWWWDPKSKTAVIESANVIGLAKLPPGQFHPFELDTFGLGAVIGALNIGELRKRMSGEAAIRACALSMGGAIAAVALSHQPVLTAAALVVAGAVWMMAVALFNIGVQLSAPRWVAGRSLAAYQAAISGGIAIGSWCWGRLTDVAGVETALLVSAVLMLASPLLGLWLRMPRIGARGEEAEVLDDPEVRLALTGRSGPLVVEIEYRVGQDNAREFHNVMQDVQLSRQRNGAYGWSIARDIADPELWTERYHCPTWLDYLRQRNRSTQTERALHQRAVDFHVGPEPVRIRRMLERPFGSVRWKEETPDRAASEVLPVIASAAGSST